MKRITAPVLSLLFVALTSACDVSESPEVADSEPGGKADDPAGRDCEEGETVPAGDGCNICSCGPSGALLCTELFCGRGNRGCEPGQTAPDVDGCNTCTCQEDGVWTCTELPCATECSPGDSVPDVDGCNTCTCQEDGSWACAALACPSQRFGDAAVEICDGPVPSDLFALDEVEVDGDTLRALVTYGGGCRDHAFRMCWDGEFGDASPTAQLLLSHDANDDACKALVSEILEFDLDPVRVPGGDQTQLEIQGGPSLVYVY